MDHPPLLALLLAVQTTACSPAPQSPAQLQLRMTHAVTGGAEVERCQFFVAPPGGLAVQRESISRSPGCHHVLLFATPYPAVPTTTRRGAALDTSGAVDCPDGAAADWEVTGVVGASLSPAGASMVDLPDGVAVRVTPGAVLLMNTHYLNATLDPMDTDTRIDLTASSTEVRQEAGLLLFDDPRILVPPLGTAAARMRCPVPRPVVLASLHPHMHARGVHFAADLALSDGGVERLYEGDSWQDVSPAVWPSGLSLPAGSALDYRCDYRNPEDHTVAAGGTTRDEMCQLWGVYYPRDLAFERCALTDDQLPGSAAVFPEDRP